MTDRERLTKHWGNNCVATKLNYDFLLSLPNIEVKNFNAIIQKLAHYEDLEEQGKIIVPPCKVGDTVYAYCEVFHVVLPYLVGNFQIAYMGEEENNRLHWEAASYDTETDELIDVIYFDLDDIGKAVFLTREEAEKALAERQGTE